MVAKLFKELPSSYGTELSVLCSQQPSNGHSLRPASVFTVKDRK